MGSLGQVALKFVLVIGKLFMLRVFACGPISRADEIKLRGYMAYKPTIWGLRFRDVSKDDRD